MKRFLILSALLSVASFAATDREHLIASAPGQASEAFPAGVPSSWSWVAGSVLHSLSLNAPYTHMNFWGAVFRDTRNVTPANTEVQIAKTTFWVLYNGATQWVKFQGQTPPDLGGASFTPQYGGGRGAPILRHTSEGSYVVPHAGDIWHYWYGNSYESSPNNIREMIVNSQARLVLRNASGTDDRDQAGYLIHVGADKRNPNDPSCANDKYICPSFGVGKFFKITKDWRNITFSSVTQADMDGGMPMPPAEVFALPIGTPVSSSSSVVSSSSTPSSSSVATHTGPWKIQPIGNSITQGDGNGGYRCKLKDLLTAANINTDFVGTSTGGSCADNQHDGHGGYTIGPGASKADEWDPNKKGNIFDNIGANGDYLKVNPDVILLQIGTNEWFNITQSGYDPNTGAAPKLRGLVDKILTAKPNVILFIASMTKANWDANLFNSLNSTIPGLVQDKVAQGFKVHYVDMSNESNFTAGDYGDALHPNASGYAKMAQVWLNHLKPVLTGSNGGTSSSSSMPSSSSSITTIVSGTVLEAEVANLGTGNGTKPTGVVAYNDVGEYLYYPQVEISNTIDSVLVTYGVPSPYQGNIAEFRLGSTSGTLVGSLTLQSTASWETMRTDATALSPWTGAQDLYVVFKQGTSSSTWIGDFDKFTFHASESTTRLRNLPEWLGILKNSRTFDLLGRKK